MTTGSSDSIRSDARTTALQQPNRGRLASRIGPKSPELPAAAKDALAMFSTVNEFCAAHRISRSLLYRLVKEGRGPRLTKINNSTRISIEAAAEWRERMERESEAIELAPRDGAKRTAAL